MQNLSGLVYINREGFNFLL